MNCLGVVYPNCWTSSRNTRDHQLIAICNANGELCAASCKTIEDYANYVKDLRQFLRGSTLSFVSCIRPRFGSWSSSKGRVQNAHIYGLGPSNVRQFNVGWHTNPQSSDRLLLPLPTPLNSPFCAQSLLCCMLHTIRAPIAPHGSHICTSDGSIVMRGRWQCKLVPGAKPHATTLCECIELCSCRRTATWRMRNICSI